MTSQHPGENLSPRTDRYDFERLERSVEYLIEDHERLSTEREALVAELVDREHRIGVLETELAALDRRRVSAVESVDRILTRLKNLEARILEVSEVSGLGGV